MKQKKSRLLFMVPAMTIYITVVVMSAIYSIFLSFFKWNGLGKMSFVGFKNYINLFTKDMVFRQAMINNLIWIALTVVFTMSIALLLAVMLNKKMKGRIVYRAIFYFPYMLSWVVVGIVWKWIYNPNIGFLDEVMHALGMGDKTIVWLSEPKIALYCVFIAALWQGIGQPMLYFLAGLQGIPKDLYEAAEMDGAGPIAKFFHVTVPQLKETFVIVFATLVISSLKVYDVVYVMTNGGPMNSTQTLASYMYSQTFNYSNLGVGSAIATIMMLIMMVIIIPYVTYSTRED